MSRDHLSFQLYSLRNFPPLDEQLDLLRRLGYRNVEPFGGLYDKLDELARGLEANELTARSGHFDLAMVESAPDRAVQIARRLGMDTVVMPYLQPDQRPADRAGWEAFGRRLAAASAALGQAGLRFAWHNHDFEFRALPDGTMPIEHLLSEGVLWEADLAWVARADVDPLPWLTRYAGRVPLVHVKDIAPAGENTDEDGWADVGHGVLDWRGLWRAALAAGAEVMVAEHDKPSDGERFARRSLAAMTSFDQEGH